MRTAWVHKGRETCSFGREERAACPAVTWLLKCWPGGQQSFQFFFFMITRCSQEGASVPDGRNQLRATAVCRGLGLQIVHKAISPKHVPRLKKRLPSRLNNLKNAVGAAPPDWFRGRLTLPGGELQRLPKRCVLEVQRALARLRFLESPRIAPQRVITSYNRRAPSNHLRRGGHAMYLALSTWPSQSRG